MTETKALYISTGAFGRTPLDRVLQECLDAGIRHLELSSGGRVDEPIWLRITELARTGQMKFLLHNYFPAPQIPFVLNLASNDPAVLETSYRHCQHAIDLCSEIKVPFFSVHAGFCFHAQPKDLGKPQTELVRIPRDQATATFVKNLKGLADHAMDRGVDLLIENNVVAPFNLTDGKNLLLLAAEATEILEILSAVNRPNLGLLTDVGHLKVSAHALGFDEDEWLNRLKGHIRAIHMSDNDGSADTNDAPTTDSWFWSRLARHGLMETTWVLEAYKLPIPNVLEQIRLAEARYGEWHP